MNDPANCDSKQCDSLNGLGMGLLFGVCFGLMFNNLALGIGLGIVFGTAFGDDAKSKIEECFGKAAKKSN